MKLYTYFFAFTSTGASKDYSSGSIVMGDIPLITSKNAESVLLSAEEKIKKAIKARQVSIVNFIKLGDE